MNSFDAAVLMTGTNPALRNVTVFAGTSTSQFADHTIRIASGSTGASVYNVELGYAADNDIIIQGNSADISNNYAGSVYNYVHDSCHGGIYFVGVLMAPPTASTRSIGGTASGNYVVNNGTCPSVKNGEPPDGIDIDRMTENTTAEYNIVTTGDIIMYDDGEQVDSSMNFSSIGNVVSYNTIYASLANGVDIAGCETGFTVTDNVIQGVTGWGIRVNGPGTGNGTSTAIIEQNTIESFTANTAGVTDDAILVGNAIGPGCTANPFGLTMDCANLNPAPSDITISSNTTCNYVVPNAAQYYAIRLVQGANNIIAIDNSLGTQYNASGVRGRKWQHEQHDNPQLDHEPDVPLRFGRAELVPVETLMKRAVRGAVWLGLAASAGITGAEAAPANTTLFSFAGQNGERPVGVVADISGVLYGTTSIGGTSKMCSGGCGTIFRLVPPTGPGVPWQHETLYSFQGGSDGAIPEAPPIVDAQGNVYGTASTGGSSLYQHGFRRGSTGGGVVWEMSPPGTNGPDWSYQVIHTFVTFPLEGGTAPTDGSIPEASLVMDGAGVLYGTTRFGGAPPDYLGTVFSVAPPVTQGGSWSETTIYDFPNGTPLTPVALSGSGNVLIGNLQGGNLVRNCYTCGLLYQLTRDGDQWTYHQRMEVPSSDTVGGVGPLLLNRDHNLFYTAGQVGVVELSPPATTGPWTAQTVYSIGSDMYSAPTGSLVRNAAGDLFGVEENGQPAVAADGSTGTHGTTFRLSPPAGNSGGWTFVPLHNFSGDPGSETTRPDGAAPAGGMVFGYKRRLYGITVIGGRYGKGTVFSQTPY